MQRTKIIILTSAVLLFGGIASFALTSAPKHEQPQVVVTAPVAPEKPTVTELFKLVNEERAKAKVAPLVLDERLNKSAQQKADDMFTRNYFAHVDPDGRHGYDIAHENATDICKNPSENLRDNLLDKNTSQEAINGWVSSSAHYSAMISSKYTHTGFGISGDKIVEHFC
jgi:uncharacterized protein YkwD